MAGLIGIAPGTIIETFVAPMIGHHAMKELESGGMGRSTRSSGAPTSAARSPSGGWSAGPSCAREGAGTSLIVGAVVLLGMMTATGPAAGVVIIVSTMIYGIALSALAVPRLADPKLADEA